MTADAEAFLAALDRAHADAREAERQYREEVLPSIVDQVLAEVNDGPLGSLLPPGCRFVYVPA